MVYLQKTGRQTYQTLFSQHDNNNENGDGNGNYSDSPIHSHKHTVK